LQVEPTDNCNPQSVPKATTNLNVGIEAKMLTIQASPQKKARGTPGTSEAGR